MVYEWDQAKNRGNFAKHGLDFADAEQVLTGPWGGTVNNSGPARRSSSRHCPRATRRRYHADYLHEKGKST